MLLSAKTESICCAQSNKVLTKKGKKKRKKKVLLHTKNPFFLFVDENELENEKLKIIIQ